MEQGQSLYRRRLWLLCSGGKGHLQGQNVSMVMSQKEICVCFLRRIRRSSIQDPPDPLCISCGEYKLTMGHWSLACTDSQLLRTWSRVVNWKKKNILLSFMACSEFVGNVTTAQTELWLLGGSIQNWRSDFILCRSRPVSLLSRMSSTACQESCLHIFFKKF